MKRRSEAVLGAAVLVMACACSGSASTPSSSARTRADTPASPASASAFAAPATGCVLSAQTVAGISGRSVSNAQAVQLTSTKLATTAHGCMYSGTEQGSVLVGIGLGPTQPGRTAHQYLADGMLDQAQTLALVPQDLPGLADAAQFSTLTVGGETIDVISLVQIRAGTVANIFVTVSGSSVTEESAIALARAVLAAISN